MALCNKPVPKKIKTEKIDDYPVDLVKSFRDLNDANYDTQLNGLRETPNSLHCWICGVEKNIKTLTIKDFDIFDDGLRGHQLCGLRCDREKPHFVGLKVAGRWWNIEEILSSESNPRNGLMEIKTLGDRLLLSVLNTIVYNQHEKASEEPMFESHPPNEAGKIMWQSGKAVGFYTVKKKGKLISHFLPEVWEMNMLDTIFVRKDYRSKGLAKHMVEDFIDDFPKEYIGFSYPLTVPLTSICFNILKRRKEDRDRVWECREPGGMHGRINLWRSLKADKMLKSS
ncbi:soluble lamin-associated protein of 75 kDa-like [Actinia tenebrosa]|uniref:Soluble lamin-associated protein of 75 kDa-like n=1 Tax=Actinia tenebrosa TaxID=6105 RepID=A0A6P8J780_ACTTE|nr:soluble lamin-associated protein of 75 kDa-like [Actinia tenebrosa]